MAHGDVVVDDDAQSGCDGGDEINVDCEVSTRTSNNSIDSGIADSLDSGGAWHFVFFAMRMSTLNLYIQIATYTSNTNIHNAIPAYTYQDHPFCIM